MSFEKKTILKIFTSTLFVTAVFLSASCGELSSVATKLPESGKVAAKTTDDAESSKTNKIPAKAVLPEAYTASCAKCHGASGEGKDKNPELFAVTTRREDPLSDKDLLDIIDDPSGFGLSSKMPAFKDKLSAEQKQEIISWIKTL